MTNDSTTFHMLDGEQALAHLDELRQLYQEVYGEPPYEWGEEHADLFVERFKVQARRAGFALVEARQGAELVGIAFGVTLQPTTPWWQNLVEPLPTDVTEERSGRTFALVELLVRKPWRRQHVAETMHDLLLDGRPEERATLRYCQQPHQHSEPMPSGDGTRWDRSGIRCRVGRCLMC